MAVRVNLEGMTEEQFAAFLVTVKQHEEMREKAVKIRPRLEDELRQAREKTHLLGVVLRHINKGQYVGAMELLAKGAGDGGEVLPAKPKRKYTLRKKYTLSPEQKAEKTRKFQETMARRRAEKDVLKASQVSS